MTGFRATARLQVLIEVKTKAALLLLAIFASGCTAIGERSGVEHDTVVISVLGTSDVHGQFLPQPGRGGLTTLSGYVAALRAARAADNGGLLLVDAGDMWQGTLESNLSEGADVVAAYNVLGYAAVTIGNHEFDFGPVGPKAIPQSSADDARGALKLRATEAGFPLLAANLHDAATQQPVAWPNVQTSTMLDIAGVQVGIVGVMSMSALNENMGANVRGLYVAPLAATIAREAQTLREQHAALVIVIAHAGGSCEAFDDATDLSSCDLSGEIMRVANDLPPGLVDYIIGGHEHDGLAHIVNGVAISESYSSTRAFGRVDFKIDRATGTTLERMVFAPQPLCAVVDTASGRCAAADADPDSIAVATYEGREVVPMPELVAVAKRAEALALERKAQKLGVYLETPITLDGRPESALGNLMTDALRDSSDADIAIHNVSGGIRADLPQGELTYGSLYQMFPFDNQLMVLDLTGADVRRIIERQVHMAGRRAGFSGMRVFVDCEDEHMSIAMLLANGREIQDDELVRVAVNDFLALGGDGVLLPVMPEGGFKIPDGLPLAREVIGSWFGERGGHLRADQFLDLENRRWNLPEEVPQGCAL